MRVQKESLEKLAVSVSDTVRAFKAYLSQVGLMPMCDVNKELFKAFSNLEFDTMGKLTDRSLTDYEYKGEYSTFVLRDIKGIVEKEIGQFIIDRLVPGCFFSISLDKIIGHTGIFIVTDFFGPEDSEYI